MQNNACKTIGPSSLENSPYQTVSAAIAALSTQDHRWLSRLTARRLRRLRQHAGLARYLAGMEPSDLIDEALQRLQTGSRRTKPKHLKTHQAFLNHLQGVINSLANNYTRHAEPHVIHVSLEQVEDDGGFQIETLPPQDVRREAVEREWFREALQTLGQSAAPESRAEVARLRAAAGVDAPATTLVNQCSETLLNHLQTEIRQGRIPGPEIVN